MNLQRTLLILSLLYVINTFAAFTDYADGCGTQVRLRKNWRSLTDREKQLYLSAVVALKQRTSTPTYNQFAEAHQGAATYAHFTPWFYYWHRWFVYRYETVLRWVAKETLGMSQADVCSIAAHFWATERDADFIVTRVAPAVFAASTFGSFTTRAQCGIPDGVFNDTWFRARFANQGCESINRDVDLRFGLPLESSLARTFARQPTYRQFWQTIENGPHGAVHNFVGGHMATMNSTDDPIFFTHHANVDRWLSIWTDMWNYDLLTPQQLTETHYSAPRDGELNRTQAVGGIDDCMTFSPTPSGLFTDPANPANCATPRRMLHIGSSSLSRGFGGMYYRYQTPDTLVNTLNTNYPQFRSNWHWFPLAYAKKRADDVNENDINGTDVDTITKRAISASYAGNFSCKSSNVLNSLVQAEYGPQVEAADQRLMAVEFRECQLYQQMQYITREWVFGMDMDPDAPGFIFPVPICRTTNTVEAMLGGAATGEGSYYVAYSTGLIAGLSILIVILVVIAVVFGILLYQENKKIHISSDSIL